MKALGVSLTLLAAALTLSRAGPLNNTGVSGRSGLCEYARQSSPGGFVPQCDGFGDFLPQQCSHPPAFCWCVNVVTGEEIPNTRTPLGTIPINCDSGFYCPYDWSRFGKQCFVFIDSPKTWAEAEGYCLFEGANLASVQSPEEDHFIQGLTRGATHEFPQTWIGGNDGVHSNFWMWSDGSKFNYENWYRVYTVERTDHCLKINYGFNRKWNYASCDETYPFVCAKNI